MDRQYNGQTIQWTDNTMDNRQRIKEQTIQWAIEKGQTIQWVIDKGQTIQWDIDKGQTI